MRTVKLILLGMAIAVFIAFVFFNWTDVDIALGPWSVVIKKPALVLLAFLAGFLPTYLMHAASRTTWRRRLARAEKSASQAELERIRPSAADPILVVRPDNRFTP